MSRLLRRAAPLIGTAGGRRVAILAPTTRHAAVRVWLRHFPGDEVHVVFDQAWEGAPPLTAPVIHVAAEPDDIAQVLDAAGVFDLVVDLRHARLRRYQQTWAQIAFYLRAGGNYLLRPPRLRTSRVSEILTVWAALLSGVPEAELGDRTVRPFAADAADLTRGAVLYPQGLVVRKRADHLRFVRAEQVTSYLPRRNPELSMSVLAELPAGVLHSRATVTSHSAAVPIEGLRSELPYPALQTRHYRGEISFYGQTLLVSGNLVLPDSHRFYRMDPLDHPLLPTWPGRVEFGMSTLRSPGRSLAGTYYLLDPQFTGHYGHLMTEALPRLWGWAEAKQAHPDLKILTMVRRGRTSEPLLDRLLPAYGIDRDDIVYIDAPVELESVITANAMWHNFAPHFAHPDLVEVWDRIAANLVDPAAPRWDRIFLTRKPGSYRTCHNGAEVEAMFRAHGFEILRPELFDLGVQAGFFRTAEVVAGWGGSQMFNLMYSTNLQQLIMLCHDGYSARNEHLYSALRGGRADWFWSAPDRRQFHSDWSFDFERNGAELETLLASL